MVDNLCVKIKKENIYSNSYTDCKFRRLMTHKINFFPEGRKNLVPPVPNSCSKNELTTPPPHLNVNTLLPFVIPASLLLSEEEVEGARRFSIFSMA
jgi:hypothetical protein